MLYIINAPILTNYGVYRFTKISVDEVRKLIERGFVSAVGHEATAKILSMLLNVEVPFNRIAISMQKGDKAIVFRLLVRIQEGKVLSEEELKALPYEIALLERVE